VFESVIEGWLDQLLERDFDEPLLAILRSRGFADIHYTHGPYEFGKDFVAKLKLTDETHQYGIQCKAGDIGGAEFDSIRGQLDELTSSRLAHPSYDAALPKKHVLLTTGRLKGKAIQSAKDVAERIRSRKEGEFLVWDRETLIDFISTSDPMRFGPSLSPQIVPLLGKLVGTTSTHRDLERWSRVLLPPADSDLKSFSIALLQNAVCAQLLMRMGRPLHALSIALNGIRVASVSVYSKSLTGEERRDLVTRACLGYLATGKSGMASAMENLHDPRAMLNWSECGPGAIVAYPTCCSRLLEYLGIACLFCRARGLDDEAANYGDQLRIVALHQPGASHPISNRYAAHVALGILGLLSSGYVDEARKLLVETTIWLCDHHEQDASGLAGAYALPEEEVAYLLGGPFECIPVCQRTHSILALALCDAAYIFFPDIYSDVLNEILAVDITPHGLHAPDSAVGMTVDGEGTQDLLNPPYPEQAGDSPLPHHEGLQPLPRDLEGPIGPLLPVAMACLTQDRLFSDVYPRFTFARHLARRPVGAGP